MVGVDKKSIIIIIIIIIFITTSTVTSKFCWKFLKKIILNYIKLHQSNERKLISA